jgi:hypothetical protein
VATQKVPLTRIDEAGASEGKVLKYSSGALAWGDDNNSGGGGGSGTAFKHTILGTESISAASLEQYQVHSGLEILSGGTFTINPSGDLVLDAPDDPNKAAGWTDYGTHIATTSILDDVCIGTQTQLSTDDKLSVAGGNLTVAGSVSAQGDVYGNARTLTNPGQVLSVQSKSSQDTTSFSADTWVTWDADLAITVTPQSSSSKFLITCSGIVGNSSQRVFLRFLRDSTAIGIGATSSSRTPCNIGSYMAGGANFHGVAGSYLDEPATASAITYQLQAYSNSGTGYLNRSSEDADGDSSPRGITTFTVMEIAG